jgi:hypothetical protein
MLVADDTEERWKSDLCELSFYKLIQKFRICLKSERINLEYINDQLVSERIDFMGHGLPWAVAYYKLELM